MICTVTLNPMLDKTVDVGRLVPGEIHRATHVGAVVGGKGVNVARQLHILGHDVVATGLWGGHIGQELAHMLDGEGIPHDFVNVHATTREGVTYRDVDGSWTAVFEPPHEVTPAEAKRLVEKCDALIGESAWLVCAGSAPGATTEDLYGRLISDARGTKTRTVLDSYGEVFSRAVTSGPTMVKVNRHECERSFGFPVADSHGVMQAMEHCVHAGAEYAIITDGQGPVYATHQGLTYHVVPPKIRPVNPTGSGDTMLAGLLHGLQCGWGFEDALRFGVAAGAANAARWDVSCCALQEIEALLNTVRVERLTLRSE